jgi:hypothetical protein
MAFNLYDYGAEVRCTGTFKQGGTNADPAVIKFDYIDPATGSVVTYVYVTDAELVRSATGVYYVDLAAATAGDWWYRFYSTGTGKAAREKMFQVRTSQFD